MLARRTAPNQLLRLDARSRGPARESDPVPGSDPSSPATMMALEDRARLECFVQASSASSRQSGPRGPHPTAAAGGSGSTRIRARTAPDHRARLQARAIMPLTSVGTGRPHSPTSTVRAAGSSGRAWSAGPSHDRRRPADGGTDPPDHGAGSAAGRAGSAYASSTIRSAARQRPQGSGGTGPGGPQFSLARQRLRDTDLHQPRNDRAGAALQATDAACPPHRRTTWALRGRTGPTHDERGPEPAVETNHP